MDLELSALRGVPEEEIATKSEKPEKETVILPSAVRRQASIPDAERPDDGAAFDAEIECEYTNALLEKYKEEIGKKTLASERGVCYNMMEAVRADYAMLNPDSDYAFSRLLGRRGQDGESTAFDGTLKAGDGEAFGTAIMQRIVTGLGHGASFEYGTWGGALEKAIEKAGISMKAPRLLRSAGTGVSGVSGSLLKSGREKLISEIGKKENEMTFLEEDGYHVFTATGRITAPMRDSWHSFTPRETGKYRVNLRNVPAQCDYDVRLYDPISMRILGAGGKKTNGEPETFLSRTELVKGKTYCLKVSGFKGTYSKSQPYVLSVTNEPVALLGWQYMFREPKMARTVNHSVPYYFTHGCQNSCYFMTTYHVFIL